jgi:hypothetical protein
MAMPGSVGKVSIPPIKLFKDLSFSIYTSPTFWIRIIKDAAMNLQ